jgi:hypothetical protein
MLLKGAARESCPCYLHWSCLTIHHDNRDLGVAPHGIAVFHLLGATIKAHLLLHGKGDDSILSRPLLQDLKLLRSLFLGY